MKRIWIAAAAAATLLLAGCAGGGAITEETFAGFPEGTTGTHDEPFAAWVDKPDTFAVVTFGSSSTDCIPKATELSVVDSSTMKVVFTNDFDGACTMDYTPTTHVLSLPDGVDADAPITVDFTQDDASSTFTLE